MEEQIWPSAERFRRVSITRSPEFVSHGGLLRALSTQRPAFVDRCGDTGKTGGARAFCLSGSDPRQPLIPDRSRLGLPAVAATSRSLAWELSKPTATAPCMSGNHLTEKRVAEAVFRYTIRSRRRSRAHAKSPARSRNLSPWEAEILVHAERNDCERSC